MVLSEQDTEVQFRRKPSRSQRKEVLMCTEAWRQEEPFVVRHVLQDHTVEIYSEQHNHSVPSSIILGTQTFLTGNGKQAGSPKEGNDTIRLVI